MPFDTDDDGNVKLSPVTGWKLAPVGETAVLLQIQYVETPEDIEMDRYKAFQFVLTPDKCLELAEALTRQGRRLLDDTMPPGQSPN